LIGDEFAVMDSNKDEGLKCLRIGRAAMEAGDKGRALKFLKMAQRLYPSAEVEEVLTNLNETKREEASAEKDSTSDKQAKNSEQTNNFHPLNSTSSAADVSAEHIEIVQRVRRTKDYYQILCLSKNCTEDEVRKAYRKLSLKVHPDKNKTAGAEEAFKAVSKAFQVLSDAELRRNYDLHGPEEESQRVRQRHTRHGAPVYYEDVFDANDIFNSFFGMHQANGSFQRTHFVRTQWTTGARGETHSVNLLSLLQLLPILFLIIVTLFPFSQPVYSLTSVSPYQFQQKTKDHEVRYYVKSRSFDMEYAPGSYARQQLEAQIETEFKDILVQNCRMELGLRRWGQASATPNCDRLERFQHI
jgi:DnaJ family protein B protein 12